MAHKNDKNNRDNKKANPKTKRELENMKMETANEPGENNQDRRSKRR